MRRLFTLFVGFALGISILSANSVFAQSADEQMNSEQQLDIENENTDKRAILVVSFGTSYDDTRDKTIGAIEDDIAKAYPAYEVRRAFTSQTVINKLAQYDTLRIDNVQQAMEKLVAEGFGIVICQPTHVMNGLEYESMVSEVNAFRKYFKKLEIGTPLLTSAQDYKDVVNAVEKEFSQIPSNEALVFMGHGTQHYANASYAAMDYCFKETGDRNIFVGTIENYPDLNTVVKQVKRFGASKVYLAPFMVTAGEHVANDMNSLWKNTFTDENFEVETIAKGLGEYSSIRQIYVKHAGEAVKAAEQ